MNETLYKNRIVLLFIPIILSIHNLEEALTMPEWILAYLPMLRSTIPIFEYLHFSTTQLYCSLLSVTIIPFLVTFLCLRGERTEKKISLLLILQAIIFWNALMPHVLGVFVLGIYNPGTITAVLLNIPFSIYLFMRVRKEEIVSAIVLKRNIIAGLILYLPIVYVNHILAHGVTKMFF